MQSVVAHINVQQPLSYDCNDLFGLTPIAVTMPQASVECQLQKDTDEHPVLASVAVFPRFRIARNSSL